MVETPDGGAQLEVHTFGQATVAPGEVRRRRHPRQAGGAVPGSKLPVSPNCVQGAVPGTVKELVSDIADYFRGP